MQNKVKALKYSSELFRGLKTMLNDLSDFLWSLDVLNWLKMKKAFLNMPESGTSRIWFFEFFNIGHFLFSVNDFTFREVDFA